MSTAGSGNADGGDRPVILDAAAGTSPVRRWAADPLPLLLLVGVAGLAVATLPMLGVAAEPGGTAAWLVPALFGVVVAGLALSGST